MKIEDTVASKKFMVENHWDTLPFCIKIMFLIEAKICKILKIYISTNPMLRF